MINLPKPLPSQYEFRGEHMMCYASDQRNLVEYRFNELGYRNDIEYKIEDTFNQTVYAWFGSSVTNGHSIAVEKSFPQLVSNKMNAACWNFSQGCFKTSNQILFEQLEMVLATDANLDIIFVQFINLERQGSGFDVYFDFDKENNVKKFEEIFMKFSDLLAGRKWYWMLLDKLQHDIPEWILETPNKIIHNPLFADCTGVTEHPGEKTHAGLAKLILKKINVNSTP